MISSSVHGILPNGEQATLYTLQAGDCRADISTYGGAVVRLFVPDKNGFPGDVVLGFDHLDQYVSCTTYFGALIGRFANRISKGMFHIDGKTYLVPCNDGGANALHGGPEGFDKRNWSALTSEADGIPALHLSLFSADGDMGFPGNLHAYVDYLLTPTGDLRISYSVTCDRKCPMNFTNHSYFNLACTGDVLNHAVKMECDRYLPVNSHLIPTGAIAPVEDTPFDFTRRKAMGHDIEEAGGYDHCLILKDGGDALKQFARVYESTSGRTLTVFTTQPAVQFYTGNFLDGKDVGKNRIPYRKHSGFCLETQCYPDAMNHDNFPDCIQKPGETYRHTTVYRFGVEK